MAVLDTRIVDKRSGEVTPYELHSYNGSTFVDFPLNSTESAYLADVTPGTITASKAVVVDSNKYVNEWTVSAGVMTQSTTVSTAALGTVRGIHGQVTGSNSAISGGNIVGVRGLVTLSGTISAGGAFLYGAQGKLIVSGTMNHADARLTGLFAQLDISAGTYTTGQMSVLWVDAGASASASAVSTKGGGQFNLVRISNTTTANANAVIYAYAEADFFLDAGGPGGNADWFDATSGGNTKSGRIKIKFNGSTGYLYVYSD